MSSEVAFQVAKEELTSAVTWVARNLPAKPSLPLLRAMIIDATEEGLEIFGYDFEVSTSVKVYADVAKTGRIAIAGKLMAEICSNLPGSFISFSTNESSVIVSSENSRFELPLINTEDYPDLPQLPEESGKVNAKSFIHAVQQVVTAATKDDNLPMLTGVNMLISGSKITFSATDRFRLALRNLEWEPVHEKVSANLLIPAIKLQEFTRIAEAGLDSEITINAGAEEELRGNGLLGITANDRKTTTKMLDAVFPNTENLIPKKYTTMVKISISELQAALRRVSLVSGRTNPVRFEFTQGSLKVSANGPDSGASEEIIECELKGFDITTAFNPAYLKDGMSTMDSDHVVLCFTDATRPAVMVPGDIDLYEPDENSEFHAVTSDFIYLLMPVRVNN